MKVEKLKKIRKGEDKNERVHTRINSKSILDNISMTPTKRRLVQNENTNNLILIFSNMIQSKPGADIKSESPAKRARYCGNGGGT